MALVLGPGPPRAALQIRGGRGGPLGPRAGAAASAQEGPLCGSRAAAQPRGQGPGTWLADPLTVQRRPLTSVSRLESTGRRPRPFPGWRELGLLTFSRVSASSSNAPGSSCTTTQATFSFCRSVSSNGRWGPPGSSRQEL